MTNRNRPLLLAQQGRTLKPSRISLYYQPSPISEPDLRLKQKIGKLQPPSFQSEWSATVSVLLPTYWHYPWQVKLCRNSLVKRGDCSGKRSHLNMPF